MNVNDLKKFIPGAPNLAPFIPLAGPFQILMGLALGVIVIFGLTWLIVGGVKFGAAGGNVNKREEARDTMKHGVYAIIGPFIFVAVVKVLVTVISLVTA
jgi:hypothetical protein